MPPCPSALLSRSTWEHERKYLTPFLLRPSLSCSSFIHRDIYRIYLPAGCASRERRQGRKAGKEEEVLPHVAFIRFPRPYPRGRVFSLSGFFGERRSTPTLSPLPLSYMYPGGVCVRVSKGAPPLHVTCSCCNFISRMRPRVLSCVRFPFSLPCFPCPFLRSARQVRLYVGVWQTHFNVSVKRC